MHTPVNTVGTIFSNFAACEVVLDGITYPSVEHAYQAAKVPPNERCEFLNGSHNLYDKHKCGLHAKRIAKAKRLHPLPVERRLSLMEDLLRQKFGQPDFRAALLATRPAVIQEIAPWDPFWGTGPDGRGLNHLGRLLMRIRDEPNNPE